MQCVDNCNDPNPRNHVLYEQPVWQTLQMFRTSAVPLRFRPSLTRLHMRSRRNALCVVVSHSSATYPRAYRTSYCHMMPIPLYHHQTQSRSLTTNRLPARHIHTSQRKAQACPPSCASAHRRGRRRRPACCADANVHVHRRDTGGCAGGRVEGGRGREANAGMGVLAAVVAGCL